MKTIQELNSKWYWRLIKVIWILISIFILIVAIVFGYESFSVYKPKNLLQAENAILSNSMVHENFDIFNKRFPNKVIELNELNTSGNDINSTHLAGLLILAEKAGKKINRVNICGRDINLGCSYDSLQSYIYDAINDKENLLVVDISQDTYNSIKEEIDIAFEIEEKAIKDIKNLESGKSNWESFYDFNSKYNVDIDEIIGYRNHHGIPEYIKIVLVSFGTLFIIALISFGMLKIAYYIILGKFNPEK